MGIDDLKYFKKETPIENINKELFESTSEYQYYNFGVAVGLYSLYEFTKHLKHEIDGEEIQAIIKSCLVGDSNKDIVKYFYRMINK